MDTWGRPELGALGPEDNLFEKIDSFAVVELLLETESEIEKALGRYIPLADGASSTARTRRCAGSRIGSITWRKP